MSGELNFNSINSHHARTRSNDASFTFISTQKFCRKSQAVYICPTFPAWEVGQLEKSLDRRREAHWHGENCLSFFCEATVIITTKYQMRRADDSVFEYI